jgi:hypothetical protein
MVVATSSPVGLTLLLNVDLLSNWPLLATRLKSDSGFICETIMTVILRWEAALDFEYRRTIKVASKRADGSSSVLFRSMSVRFVLILGRDPKIITGTSTRLTRRNSHASFRIPFRNQIAFRSSPTED